MTNTDIQMRLYDVTYPMVMPNDEYMTMCWLESKLTWGNAFTSLIGIGDPWYVRAPSVIPLV